MSDSLQLHGLHTQDFLVLHYLLEFAQTHVHQVSDAIQPSHPLSSPSPPVLNLSQHLGLFQWGGPLHWNFSISPSDEYSGLISFRMDWVDLLAVQGTLKSLLQHHSSKASFYINYLYKVSISKFSNILEIKILTYEWRGTILSMRLLPFALQIHVFLTFRMLSPYHNSYQSLTPLQNQPWFQNLI